MNYTQPCTPKQTLQKKHSLSDEARSIKKYVATHDLSVTFSQENSPVITFVKKK